LLFSFEFSDSSMSHFLFHFFGDDCLMTSTFMWLFVMGRLLDVICVYSHFPVYPAIVHSI